MCLLSLADCTMGKQNRVRYKLAWPGLGHLPVYVIDASDVVYDAKHRLPSAKSELNQIENQYVKVSHVMAMLEEHERYNGNILLHKLITDFNLRGLRTIASLSTTSMGQLVVVDQYLPLTTLLPFLLVCPSHIFTTIFHQIINYLNTYLETVCFDCGFIHRNCICNDGGSPEDEERSVGFAVCYSDKEVQTSDKDIDEYASRPSPPPPLQCMEAMSKTGMLARTLPMPSTNLPDPNIGVNGNSSGVSGVRVRLPADLQLPRGVRLPLTMVPGFEGADLMPGLTGPPHDLPATSSMINMASPLPFMAGSLASIGMMNFGNQRPLPVRPSTPAYAPVSLPPIFQPRNIPFSVPDMPFMQFMPPMPPVLMPPHSEVPGFNNAPIMASYSSTAYDPATVPSEMGEPHGQVAVKLPAHMNPKYINTTLGTFKRLGGARNIGVQVESVQVKKKANINLLSSIIASDTGPKKMEMKVKLGKYKKRGPKKDSTSKAMSKIKKLKLKPEIAQEDPSVLTLESECVSCTGDDIKTRLGNKKSDKVWRMIKDDEDSDEEGLKRSEKDLDRSENHLKNVMKPSTNEMPEANRMIPDGHQNNKFSTDSKQVNSSDVCVEQNKQTCQNPTLSDTETVGAEDQTQNAKELDKESSSVSDCSVLPTEVSEVRKLASSEQKSDHAMPQKTNDVEPDQTKSGDTASVIERGYSAGIMTEGMTPQSEAQHEVMTAAIAMPKAANLSCSDEILRRNLAVEALGSLAHQTDRECRRTSASAGEQNQGSRVIGNINELETDNRGKDTNTALSIATTVDGDTAKASDDLALLDAGSTTKMLSDELETSDLIIDEGRSDGLEPDVKTDPDVNRKDLFDMYDDDLPAQARNPNVDNEKKYFAKFEHLPTGEKLYKCTYPRCLQCFDTRVAAKLHNQCHSKNESVRYLLCPQCDYKTPFFRWFDLLRHLRETHKMGLTDQPNGCLFCGLEFNSQELLARHLEFHYSSRYKCVHCGLMMMSWGQVEQHVATCPEKDQVKVNFGCPYCMFVFHKKTIRNLHMLSHSDTGLTCALCEDNNVQWQHWKLLRKHYQTRHSKALMAKIGPFRHLLPMKKRNPKCHVCGLEFKVFDVYSLHIIKVHDLVPFTLLSCRLCDKAFRTKRRLDYHMKNAHEEEAACDECDYIAKNKTFLKLHMSQNHTEKQHMCTECGKSFMYYHQLRVHMAHHARKIVHTCRHCNSEFTRSTELRKHLAEQHPGPGDRKTYNCSQCDYWTYAKSTLAYHVQKKHIKHDLHNDVEISAEEQINQNSQGQMYPNSYLPGPRKRKLSQDSSTLPRVGRRKKRKRLTMPVRRVSTPRLQKENEIITATKLPKHWIADKPVRNRDQRRRIRLEEMEQKKLKKMRKHSCARTRSMEEQRAIQEDTEVDLFDSGQLDITKTGVIPFGKKYVRSVSKDESMMVNLSYPYIDHNYYQLETQAEFNTLRSSGRPPSRRCPSGSKSGLPVSMDVVSTPRVSGFEECETSPGDSIMKSRARDSRHKTARHQNHNLPSADADGSSGAASVSGSSNKLHSPVEIRSLLTRALQGSPSTASSLTQQLRSLAIEMPSLEDFPELVSESGEILPEQDLGLITEILNSIDTSVMNLGDRMVETTTSPNENTDLPTPTQDEDGINSELSAITNDARRLVAPETAKSGAGCFVSKQATSSQNSVVGSGFEDGVLNPAKSTPTEEVPTDIDEIELKEADYQLWHEEPPPPGQCQEANLDHSLAGTSVVVIDGPIKHTDLVLPSSDTSQPSTWLVDHQYC